ncbi:MAG: SDR family NAD(P)-dependent oxidoreductase [Pseudonocardiaceae bacterium]
MTTFIKVTMGHAEPLLQLAQRTGIRPRFDPMGKTILVTGASSGIGRLTVLRLAELGAYVIAVARREDKLIDVMNSIEPANRGTAYPCNLADRKATRRLTEEITKSYGGVDALINNAALSIRRWTTESFDRLHDYERTINLNYLAAVQLTLAFIPGMLERGGGRIVNSGTWGVPGGTMPRFAAYHASKSALTSFGRSVNAELGHRNIRVSTVHFPLVRTPMAAQTAQYRDYPALTPDQAAQWIIDALALYPAEVMPAVAKILHRVGRISPRAADKIVVKIGI